MATLTSKEKETEQRVSKEVATWQITNIKSYQGALFCTEVKGK